MKASDFAACLRDYRKQQRWTQAEMAEEWAYSFETISAWERRKRIPGRVEVPRLAQLLGVEEQELFILIDQGKERQRTGKQLMASQKENDSDDRVACPFSGGQLLWTLHLGIGVDGLQCIISRPLGSGQTWDVILDPTRDFDNIQQVYQLINEQVCAKARERQGASPLNIVPFERVV